VRGCYFDAGFILVALFESVFPVPPPTFLPTQFGFSVSDRYDKVVSNMDEGNDNEISGRKYAG
jgi:hypothetical protein